MSNEYEDKKLYNDTISALDLTQEEDISLDQMTSGVIQLTQAWVGKEISRLNKRAIALIVDTKKKRQEVFDEEYDDFLTENRKSYGERLPIEKQRRIPPKGKKGEDEPKGVIIERISTMAVGASISAQASTSSAQPPIEKPKNKRILKPTVETIEV